MKITVTLYCRHNGYSNHEDITGKTITIDANVVELDGVEVVWRDRRRIANREPGHPWVSSPADPGWTDPDHRRKFEAWTGFSVTIDDTRS